MRRGEGNIFSGRRDVSFSACFTPKWEPNLQTVWVDLCTAMRVDPSWCEYQRARRRSGWDALCTLALRELHNVCRSHWAGEQGSEEMTTERSEAVWLSPRPQQFTNSLREDKQTNKQTKTNIPTKWVLRGGNTFDILGLNHSLNNLEEDTKAVTMESTSGGTNN